MQAEFLFDVGSPNAYLAHRVLPEIEKRTGVSFAYVPVLLGGLFKATNNKSPMVAYADVPNKLAYERLELERFVKKHRVSFTFNEHFPVNTLSVMRVVTGAQLEGDLMKVLDAAMHHMWEKPKKLDDPAVLKAALKESGLDAEHLFERSQDQQVKDALLKNTQEAAARGAFGIPTFFVNGAMFFGKDRLRDIEDEVTRALSANGH